MAFDFAMITFNDILDYFKVMFKSIYKSVTGNEVANSFEIFGFTVTFGGTAEE